MRTPPARSNASLPALYELPFGPGQRWLNSGETGKLLGGWQVSAILTYNNSQPLAITQSGESLMNGTNRPNFNPGSPLWSGNYGQITKFFEGKGPAPTVVQHRRLEQHRQPVCAGQRQARLQRGSRSLVPGGEPERQEDIPYHRGNFVHGAHGLLQRVQPRSGSLPDHHTRLLQLRPGHQQVLCRQPPGTDRGDLQLLGRLLELQQGWRPACLAAAQFDPPRRSPGSHHAASEL